MSSKIILITFVILNTITSAQWFVQNSGTTNSLQNVYSLDLNNAIVVGNYATILKTSNGGTTWIQYRMELYLLC